MIQKTVYTPLGSLVLSETDGKICGVHWGHRHHQSDSEALNRASLEIEKYFSGNLTNFTAPYNLEGTPFQRKVWQAMAEIAYGETVTYGELARELNTSARAVGGACGKNILPIIIPCHRVLGHENSLGGYSGGDGLLTKSVLLDFEKRAPGSESSQPIFDGLRRRVPRKPFYFMRHGLTDLNVQHIFQGSGIDAPLNETGHQQARTAAAGIKTLKDPIIIWHSGLKRTIQTAEHLVSALSSHDVKCVTHDGLTERSMGALEGTSMKETKKWHPWQSYPEAETWLQLKNRISETFGYILSKEYQTPPLVVSHGWVGKSLGELLGLWGPDINMKNCEICYIEPDESSEDSWLYKRVFAGE